MRDGASLESEEVRQIVGEMTPGYEQCKQWLDKYLAFDKTNSNEDLFRLLEDGAELAFKLKDYKELKDFCNALKKTMAAEVMLSQLSQIEPS